MGTSDQQVGGDGVGDRLVTLQHDERSLGDLDRVVVGAFPEQELGLDQLDARLGHAVDAVGTGHHGAKLRQLPARVGEALEDDQIARTSSLHLGDPWMIAAEQPREQFDGAIEMRHRRGGLAVLIERAGQRVEGAGLLQRARGVRREPRVGAGRAREHLDAVALSPAQQGQAQVERRLRTGRRIEARHRGIGRCDHHVGARDVREFGAHRHQAAPAIERRLIVVGRAGLRDGLQVGRLGVGGTPQLGVDRRVDPRRARDQRRVARRARVLPELRGQ